MQQLRRWKDRHIIKVITGMRRSGKSTILKMLIEEISPTVAAEQIQFYNFEDLDTLAIGDIFQIHKHIVDKLVSDKMNYIFLDEIQNVKDFERMVDSLYIKENVDLYITGSNAYLLSGELATLLTGRYVEISILPFSFSEYCTYAVNSQNFDIPDNFRNLESDITKRATANYLFPIYMEEGGIPQVATTRSPDGKQSVLSIASILNTIIEKDVFSRQEVYNKSTFYKIVDFLFDSIGSPVSPNSIVNTLKSEQIIVDRKTIVRYMDVLSDAFLLSKVSRHNIRGRGLLRDFDKYYLADTGFLRVRSAKATKADAGHKLENIVYLELLRRYRRVFIGKVWDKEIDFVVEDYEGYISYYQVAYTTMAPDTLERELSSLKAVNDSNPKYLLTMDSDINPVYNGIRKLNVVEWLMGTE
jgi:predicted AAA+ superfamily ATPase